MISRSSTVVLLALASIAISACKKKDAGGTGATNAPAAQPGTAGPGKPPAGAASGTPFLQGTKDVPAHLEWNRDFGSSSGGTIVFRVSCDAPFSVTVVTDKGYQALLRKDKAQFDKSSMLLTLDATPPSYEGRVTVPPGRMWFIVANRSNATAKMSLECYKAD